MLMRTGLRLLAVLTALLVFSARGCGDEGGSCGPAPEKKEDTTKGGAGDEKNIQDH